MRIVNNITQRLGRRFNTAKTSLLVCFVKSKGFMRSKLMELRLLILMVVLCYMMIKLARKETQTKNFLYGLEVFKQEPILKM